MVAERVPEAAAAVIASHEVCRILMEAFGIDTGHKHYRNATIRFPADYSADGPETDRGRGSQLVAELPQTKPARRGRPESISAKKKLAAIAVRRQGLANREAAKILYDVKHPTPQQTKNASTILRTFAKRRGIPWPLRNGDE